MSEKNKLTQNNRVPSASFTKFRRPVEAVARGVAAVTCKQLCMAKGETGVPSGDQLQTNYSKEHDMFTRKRCYPSPTLDTPTFYN